jgi:hypothetical protein
MADVTTYKRCNTTYIGNTNIAYHVGDIRAATDPVVVANPTLWTALTDTEMASGRKGQHDA